MPSAIDAKAKRACVPPISVVTICLVPRSAMGGHCMLRAGKVNRGAHGHSAMTSTVSSDNSSFAAIAARTDVDAWVLV